MSNLPMLGPMSPLMESNVTTKIEQLAADIQEVLEGLEALSAEWVAECSRLDKEWRAAEKRNPKDKSWSVGIYPGANVGDAGALGHVLWSKGPDLIKSAL